MPKKFSIKSDYFLNHLKRNILKKFKIKSLTVPIEIGKSKGSHLSSSNAPVIISIVREEKYFRMALSVSSRIALCFPKLKHHLFTDENMKSDTYIKFPNNLTTHRLSNYSTHAFFKNLGAVKVEVVILIDSDEWIELFLECKKRGLNVFWINAHKSEIYAPLRKILNLNFLFRKTSRFRHNNVFAFAKNQKSKDLLMDRNEGFNIIEKVGSFKSEPVTLSETGKSRVYKNFTETNYIVWFAAGAYEEELLPILKCQIALTESIPNIYLLLLPKNANKNKVKLEKAIQDNGLYDFGLVKHNVFLVEWDKDEIISSLNCSRVTLLGGSLLEKGHSSEVFDPMLPISYSSAVVVGPNHGQNIDLIGRLINGDAIKAISKNKKSSVLSSKDLYQAIFDSLKSSELANRISNAWSLTTDATGIADELIRKLKDNLEK